MYAYAAKHGYKKLIVLTDSYAPQTLEAARNIPDGSARLLNFDEVYRLIKALKAEPDVKTAEKRKDKKAILKNTALKITRYETFVLEKTVFPRALRRGSNCFLFCAVK